MLALIYSQPCTNQLSPNVAWTNQELFNHVNHSLETHYQPLEDIYFGDSYISGAGFGVTYSGVHILHTKVDRDGM